MSDQTERRVIEAAKEWHASGACGAVGDGAGDRVDGGHGTVRRGPDAGPDQERSMTNTFIGFGILDTDRGVVQVGALAGVVVIEVEPVGGERARFELTTDEARDLAEALNSATSQPAADWDAPALDFGTPTQSELAIDRLQQYIAKSWPAHLPEDVTAESLVLAAIEQLENYAAGVVPRPTAVPESPPDPVVELADEVLGPVEDVTEPEPIVTEPEPIPTEEETIPTEEDAECNRRAARAAADTPKLQAAQAWVDARRERDRLLSMVRNKRTRREFFRGAEALDVAEEALAAAFTEEPEGREV